MDDSSPAEPPGRAGRDVVLSCRGVRKAWPTGAGVATPALEGVDLDVAEGEAVALIGPSGCGKTTLLRILAGLDPPNAGLVTAHGAPVRGPSPDRPLVFQQPTLFPWLTVWENIGFGLAMKGVPRAELRAAAQALLSATGLPDVADSRPETLSLGMRQRVAVVRAMAIRPSLLLLDEPFAALDIQTRHRLQAFLRTIRETSGAAVVLVTHDVDEALAVCDRVVMLSARPGRVLLEIAGESPRGSSHAGADSGSKRKLEVALRAEADRAFASDDARASISEE